MCVCVCVCICESGTIDTVCRYCCCCSCCCCDYGSAVTKMKNFWNNNNSFSFPKEFLFPIWVSTFPFFLVSLSYNSHLSVTVLYIFPFPWNSTGNPRIRGSSGELFTSSTEYWPSADVSGAVSWASGVSAEGLVGWLDLSTLSTTFELDWLASSSTVAAAGCSSPAASASPSPVAVTRSMNGLGHRLNFNGLTVN